MSTRRRLVSRAVVAPTISPTEDYQHRLWWFNALLGLFHGATAIAMGVLVDTQLSDATVPAFSHLPGKRPDVPGVLWLPQQKLQRQVIVGYFAAAFLALASLNHLWVTTVGWPQYLANLRLGRNPVRWFEYSFSASLMHVHVAMLSGSMDVHVNFLIFGLTMTTMIFGWLGEPDAAGKRVRGSFDAFFAGFVPYTFQWLVIFCMFFTAVTQADPPDFVWAIIFVILALDLSFAVNMYLNLANKVSFLQAELIYCVLSLTSKQLLAWINYGGTRSLLED